MNVRYWDLGTTTTSRDCRILVWGALARVNVELHMANFHLYPVNIGAVAFPMAKGIDDVQRRSEEQGRDLGIRLSCIERLTLLYR